MGLGELSVDEVRYLYDATRKWFLIIAALTLPAQLFINAPFGRFTPKSDWLTFDGRKTWFLMEIISPLLFFHTLFSNPLSNSFPSSFLTFQPSLAHLTTPQIILASAYGIHYLNRAIISPLRTPSRSRIHLIVPLAAAFGFNTPNGFLNGAYLGSEEARVYLNGNGRISFWVGLGLWAVGFAGNVVHDEILANIRRDANRKQASGKKTDGDGTEKPNQKQKVGEHYAIPHGLLFTYISFPNYFCEWVEWFGWALAAAPFPFPLSFSTLLSLLSPSTLLTLLSPTAWLRFLTASPTSFAPTLTPPYIFLLNEIFTMLPRAYRGQVWYKERFGEGFPRGRGVVVPFLY